MFRWLNSFRTWSAQSARERILAGSAPAGMRFEGNLSLAGSRALRALPARLRGQSIDISDCPRIRELPAGLQCGALILRRSGIERLPADLVVESLLDAEGCRRLLSLPPLRVDQLNLRGCTALERLPEGLAARILDVSHCSQLTEIPASAARYVHHLNASQCASLEALPESFVALVTLNVSGCSKLGTLPDGITVRRWIDVAGSGLESLPWSLRSVNVLWGGVPVSDRVAFNPETITVAEILKERNLTVRRVLIERVGMEWFLEHANATVLDSDRDGGGQRRLLRVSLDGEEDLVCVQVRCPSTAKQYFLRVPPDMRTCQQAIAWTAGYGNPLAYQPAVET
jgi:Domain of unknown function (DUF6745)